MPSVGATRLRKGSCIASQVSSTSAKTAPSGARTASRGSNRLRPNLMPSTSADAPAAVGSTLTYMNAAMSLTDWLMSGLFEKFPRLKIAYSEGQIGWIPYILERADAVWEDNRGWGGVADKVLRPPSEYYYEHVYGCFFDDAHGLKNLDAVGVNNVTFETDYPHSDSTWPHTKKVAEEIMKDLTQEQVDKICRTNAIEMLHLDLDS